MKQGRRVRLKDLQGNAELNGTYATLMDFDENKRRWRVNLGGGVVKNLKEANLVLDDASMEDKKPKKEREKSKNDLDTEMAAFEAALLGSKTEEQFKQQQLLQQEEARIAPWPFPPDLEPPNLDGNFGEDVQRNAQMSEALESEESKGPQPWLDLPAGRPRKIAPSKAVFPAKAPWPWFADAKPTPAVKPQPAVGCSNWADVEAITERFIVENELAHTAASALFGLAESDRREVMGIKDAKPGSSICQLLRKPRSKVNSVIMSKIKALTQGPCKQGRYCLTMPCRRKHPDGRVIDGTSLFPDDEPLASGFKPALVLESATRVSTGDGEAEQDEEKAMEIAMVTERFIKDNGLSEAVAKRIRLLQAHDQLDVMEVEDVSSVKANESLRLGGSVRDPTGVILSRLSKIAQRNISMGSGASGQKYWVDLPGTGKLPKIVRDAITADVGSFVKRHALSAKTVDELRKRSLDEVMSVLDEPPRATRDADALVMGRLRALNLKKKAPLPPKEAADEEKLQSEISQYVRQNSLSLRTWGALRMLTPSGARSLLAQSPGSLTASTSGSKAPDAIVSAHAKDIWLTEEISRFHKAYRLQSSTEAAMRGLTQAGVLKVITDVRDAPVGTRVTDMMVMAKIRQAEKEAPVGRPSLAENISSISSQDPRIASIVARFKLTDTVDKALRMLTPDRLQRLVGNELWVMSLGEVDDPSSTVMEQINSMDPTIASSLQDNKRTEVAGSGRGAVAHSATRTGQPAIGSFVQHGVQQRSQRNDSRSRSPNRGDNSGAAWPDNSGAAWPWKNSGYSAGSVSGSTPRYGGGMNSGSNGAQPRHGTSTNYAAGRNGGAAGEASWNQWDASWSEASWGESSWNEQPNSGRAGLPPRRW